MEKDRPRAAGARGPAGAGSATAWPWPYAQLDPAAVARRAYELYWTGACMYGAGGAIIEELRGVVGYPYTVFPIDMLRYGEGGVAGWSTICGALNGAGAAICLVSGAGVYRGLVDELVRWYTLTPFPRFTPEEPRVAGGLPTSVPGSPLCRASVDGWCRASGCGPDSRELSERCGRLTGDVAAHAVELLNGTNRNGTR